MALHPLNPLVSLLNPDKYLVTLEDPGFDPDLLGLHVLLRFDVHFADNWFSFGEGRLV